MPMEENKWEKYCWNQGHRVSEPSLSGFMYSSVSLYFSENDIFIMLFKAYLVLSTITQIKYMLLAITCIRFRSTALGNLDPCGPNRLRLKIHHQYKTIRALLKLVKWIYHCNLSISTSQMTSADCRFKDHRLILL